MTSVRGDSDDPTIAAVVGMQTGVDGAGVLGIGQGNGVIGQSKGPHGFSGVRGESEGGPGVSGESTASVGVDAKTKTGQAAVRAVCTGNGSGVFGTSPHIGVFGTSTGTEGFSGVHGESVGGPGVSGLSSGSVGVDARTRTGPAAIRAVHQGNGLAGLFQGHVHVSGEVRADGDLHCQQTLHSRDVNLLGADLAEQFNVVGPLDAEPGSVVVLAGDDQVRLSDKAYDRCVAGVVSGAGDYRPAIVLDRQADAGRRPIALTGKVWCKVDADCGAIAVGDMLTTSPTPGHAMRATDPARAFGAVLGKALGGLESGRGLVPVLVTLH